MIMGYNARIFAFKDSGEKTGMIELKSEQEAREYNNRQYAICWNLNDIEGDRKSENVKKINCWIADIDEGTKEEQLAKIKKLYIEPSMLIETCHGYHCYWWAEDATKENYAKIEEGIIIKLNADKHCKDTARVLRVPDFWHQKDYQKPFLIKKIYDNGKKYTERAMMMAFPVPKPVVKAVEYHGDKEDLIKLENIEKIFKPNQILEGGRNSTLARYVLWLRDEGFDRATVERVALNINAKTPNPLPEYEVKAILRGKF